MVGGVGLLLDDGQQLGERGGRLLGVQPVGRHALQLDLGDDAERARARPGPRANTSGSTSAEHSSVDPSASTRVSPLTAAAMPWRRVPVPWVPVAIAPLIVCRSMSPRFGRASPSACSAGLSTCSGVPASTRTRRRSRSIPSTPLSRSTCSSSPSVATSGVNEWPDPATRTRSRAPRRRRTASATPVRPSRRAAPPPGSHSRCRPQLRHSLTRSSFLHRGTTGPSPTSSPPATRCTTSNRSSSSPALAPRIHTRSPIRSPSASVAVQRGLHLAGRLGAHERQPAPHRRRHPRPAGLPAGDVAAPEGRDVARRRAAARRAGRTPSPAAG